MAAQSKFKHLLSPIKLGDLELKNRVILASMTRNRNLVPQQVNVEYYTQRANAGLVLTEGTMVSQQGSQWPNAPGIYTEEQTEAWKKVVDSVHNAGGVIFLQVSLPDCLSLSEFLSSGFMGLIVVMACWESCTSRLRVTEGNRKACPWTKCHCGAGRSFPRFTWKTRIHYSNRNRRSSYNYRRICTSNKKCKESWLRWCGTP